MSGESASVLTCILILVVVGIFTYLYQYFTSNISSPEVSTQKGWSKQTNIIRGARGGIKIQPSSVTNNVLIQLYDHEGRSVNARVSKADLPLWSKAFSIKSQKPVPVDYKGLVLLLDPDQDLLKVVSYYRHNPNDKVISFFYPPHIEQILARLQSV